MAMRVEGKRPRSDSLLQHLFPRQPFWVIERRLADTARSVTLSQFAVVERRGMLRAPIVPNGEIAM